MKMKGREGGGITEGKGYMCVCLSHGKLSWGGLGTLHLGDPESAGGIARVRSSSNRVHLMVNLLQ